MFTQNVVFAITSDGESKFNVSESDLEGDDQTNVPLVNLEYASNDALDSNREPTITHKENTLQLDGGAIKSSEKQYGTFNTDDQATCCQGDPPEHHNLQGSQHRGHYPSMLENEGHNPLIQQQAEVSSADMSSGSHYPSHAKHDEGLAHHHTSGGEIEDMPSLLAVSLPADSGTLWVHGTPTPSDITTNTEEDQCVEDKKEGSSTVEPITWGQY
jgi:hypothetical protein